MSVLIKEMALPHSCAECSMWIADGCCITGYQRFTRTYIDLDFNPSAGRHESCPFIELPTQHGRLVDVGYLYDHAGDFLSNYNLIDSAPTVVEAEGEDE